MDRSTRIKRQRFHDDIKHILRHIEAVIEFAMLVLVYYFIWKGQYSQAGKAIHMENGENILMLVYTCLIFILFLYCDCFKFGFLKYSDVVISQWISIILVDSVTYFQLCLVADRLVKILPILAMIGIDVVIVAACTYVFTIIHQSVNIPKRMVMIYGKEDSITLKFKMDTRADKFQIKRLISIQTGYSAICKEIINYDAVVINDVKGNLRDDIVKFCYDKAIPLYMAPKISDIITNGAKDINLFDTPLKLINGRGLTWGKRFRKRAFDIAFSLFLMILAAPIMLLVAVAIKIEDGGPVFYRQKRVTRDGKVFNILKFRSMIVDAEKDGKSKPAVDGDSRITKVGRITRATRIDELPQLLNILKGDMSVVGPRPERVEHVEEFSKELAEFSFRTKVKGGLTGYAQIYGKYNTSAYDKLRLDLIYIEDYSFVLDIKLILMTLRIIFKPEATEGFDRVEEMEMKKRKILEEATITKIIEKNV